MQRKLGNQIRQLRSECERELLTTLSIISILFLIGCDSIMNHLPAVPGATLVKSVETSGGGQIAECMSVGVEELYGTNELSFAEILDFYTRSLEATGWHLRSSSAEGQTFETNEFVLDVSNLYDVSLVGRDAVAEGKSRFKTIYLLYLSTPIVLPVPKKCTGD